MKHLKFKKIEGFSRATFSWVDEPGRPKMTLPSDRGKHDGQPVFSPYTTCNLTIFLNRILQISLLLNLLFTINFSRIQLLQNIIVIKISLKYRFSTQNNVLV